MNDLTFPQPETSAPYIGAGEAVLAPAGATAAAPAGAVAPADFAATPPIIVDWLRQQTHPAFLPALACEVLFGWAVDLLDARELERAMWTQIGPHNSALTAAGREVIICITPSNQPAAVPLPPTQGGLDFFLYALTERHPDWTIALRNGFQPDAAAARCWIAEVSRPERLAEEAAGAFAPTPETAFLFAALLCAATDPDMVEGLATCGEQLAQVFAPLTPVPGNQ